MLSLSFKSIHEKLWKKTVHGLKHRGLYKCKLWFIITEITTMCTNQLPWDSRPHHNKQDISFMDWMTIDWMCQSDSALCAVFQKSHHKFHISCSVCYQSKVWTYLLIFCYCYFPYSLKQFHKVGHPFKHYWKCLRGWLALVGPDNEKKHLQIYICI